MTKSEVQKAEANGRIASFNQKLQKLIKEYDVTLKVQHSIIVVDDKDYSQKASK